MATRRTSTASPSRLWFPCSAPAMAGSCSPLPTSTPADHPAGRGHRVEPCRSKFPQRLMHRPESLTRAHPNPLPRPPATRETPGQHPRPRLVLRPRHRARVKETSSRLATCSRRTRTSAPPGRRLHLRRGRPAALRAGRRRLALGPPRGDLATAGDRRDRGQPPHRRRCGRPGSRGKKLVARPERQFLFRLALALHMTVAELEQKLSDRELEEWIAFHRHVSPLPDPYWIVLSAPSRPRSGRIAPRRRLHPPIIQAAPIASAHAGAIGAVSQGSHPPWRARE